MGVFFLILLLFKTFVAHFLILFLLWLKGTHPDIEEFLMYKPVHGFQSSVLAMIYSCNINWGADSVKDSNNRNIQISLWCWLNFSKFDDNLDFLIWMPSRNNSRNLKKIREKNIYSWIHYHLKVRNLLIFVFLFYLVHVSMHLKLVCLFL